jgi:hypothetical protein
MVLSLLLKEMPEKPESQKQTMQKWFPPHPTQPNKKLNISCVLFYLQDWQISFKTHF